MRHRIIVLFILLASTYGQSHAGRLARKANTANIGGGVDTMEGSGLAKTLLKR